MSDLILLDPKTTSLEGRIRWSNNRIDAIRTCDRRYYLQYVKSPRPKVPLPVAVAKGLFMHKRLEKFFNEKGEPKNKSPEAFANSAANIFNRFVIKTGKINGQEIDWEGKNKYGIRGQIRNLCREVYPMMVEDGPSVINPEYEFNFLLDGRWFNGKFDSILPGMIIQDFKTTGWSPSQFRLDNMYQFTIYALAFCSYCHDDESFRKAACVDEEVAAKWGGYPTFISDEVLVKYFKLHYYKKDDIVEKPKKLDTRRDDSNYGELCDLVDQLTEKAHEMRETNTYMPNRGNHCERCFYTGPCEDMGYDFHPKEREHGQLLLLNTYQPRPQRKKPRQKSLRLGNPNK